MVSFPFSGSFYREKIGRQGQAFGGCALLRRPMTPYLLPDFLAAIRGNDRCENEGIYNGLDGNPLGLVPGNLSCRPVDGAASNLKKGLAQAFAAERIEYLVTRFLQFGSTRIEG